jgi:hypothetical protein
MNKLILLAIICISCEAPEIPKPVSVKKLTKVYTIQPLVGSSFNPTFLTNLSNEK